MISVGTSGWSYDHWEDVLYPRGTPGKARLDWYCGSFGTVELNSSFYHWPHDRVFASWSERTPPGFRMTVKAPRALTHAKRLYAPEAWIEGVSRGLHELGDRRGMLLLQLPPALPVDVPRLRYALEHIPRWIQVAVEFRHSSWHCDEVWTLLEQTGATYCVMGGAGLPCVLRATARAVYVRLHGPDPDALYGGSYSDDNLHWWADRIREWSGAGHDVWVYFNNDGMGNAVRNAKTLRGILGV